MNDQEAVNTSLKSYVDRYERLQEEINELNLDRGALMKEIERNGLKKKIFKLVIKRRRVGKDLCDEEDTEVALYERAIEAATSPSRVRAGAREEIQPHPNNLA